VYRKRWTNVSPYYDNTLVKMTLVPDLIPDRVRVAPIASRSSGIELSAHRAFSTSLEGWAAYSWSRVVDDFANSSVLRGWDQPHALTAGFTWTESPVATEAVVGWHRGWPRTPFRYVPQLGPSPPQLELAARDSSRWGNFFTLDLRSSWSFPIAGSDLSLWAELTNTTNRRNPCCTRFLPAQATDLAITQPGDWFARAFDVGFIWRFGDRR
jgi:hypothetical protein